MKTIDLGGTWRYRAIDRYRTLPKSNRSVLRWMNGTVPGTVHTDLLANRKLPDPFYRMQETDVQWVDSQQWVYRRLFTVPKSFLGERRIDLVAGGLDTYAMIICNGHVVEATENMFVEHRISLKEYLREGENAIEIHFDSPAVRSKAKEKEHGPLRVVLEPHRVYVRKAQYSFSWDWGPKLTTSGIWRNISLEGYSAGRLADPCVKVISATAGEAVLSVSAMVVRTGRQRLALRTFIGGHGWNDERVTEVSGSRVEFTLRVPRPKLWWPNGYGGQPLYAALFTLLAGEEVLQEREIRFGIRTVRLVQEADREGRSFILEINGKRIFCKGADWIPSDTFIPRIKGSTYTTLLTMAQDAHMNMIRVWGGGIYEQEVFYETCDRLGLMVWQDFMFACGEYPEVSWFLRLVRDEAEKAVRRLRNHPSVVLWCGNNECEWLFCTENPEKGPDDMRGAKIFRDILPEVVRREDGTRPYWRSSPFGTGFPNDESNGNHHQWHVWSYWKDYPEYENDRARFVTEFGFQAPANRTTMEAVTVKADRHPQSKVMEHHNKQVEGPERLMRFLAAHHTLPVSFNDFLLKGQLVQAEALKCAAEHWRRRKFMTAGVLFWQLNDCWPVSSWAVIDSALRPKAAYYFARRFFAPVLVSFRKDPRGLELWVTSDQMKVLRGDLKVTVRSFSGQVAWTSKAKLSLPSNSSRRIQGFVPPDLSADVRRTAYVHAELLRNGKVVAENRHFFEEPKHLVLPEPMIRVAVSAKKDGSFVARLSARALARYVCIEVQGSDIVFEDNFFDLDPRRQKSVTFRCHESLSAVRRKIRVTSLI